MFPYLKQADGRPRTQSTWAVPGDAIGGRQRRHAALRSRAEARCWASTPQRWSPDDVPDLQREPVLPPEPAASSRRARLARRVTRTSATSATTSRSTSTTTSARRRVGHGDALDRLQRRPTLSACTAGRRDGHHWKATTTSAWTAVQRGGSVQAANGGTDPLLAASGHCFELRTRNAEPTSPTPTLSAGSATRGTPEPRRGVRDPNYIETEITENTTWGSKATASGNPARWPRTDRAARTRPTAFGNENPSAIVTGEHSGLANLIPGNPGQVDPPELRQRRRWRRPRARSPPAATCMRSATSSTPPLLATTPVAGTGESASAPSRRL